MIEALQETTGNVVAVKASGKLTEDDYHGFVPRLEQAIEAHGKVRILFVLDDFHGWDLKGFWEDVKFDFKHEKDVERVAFVSDQKGVEWMAKLCKIFTHPAVQTFHSDQLDEAKAWVSEGASA